MSDFYEEILKLRSEGKSGALATIVSTRGSTPREVGAKMLILEDGKFRGSVGGGCMEAEVWQEAMKVMAEDRPKTLHLDLTGREAEEGGMICGGIMDIYIEPITPPPKVFVFGGGISLFSYPKSATWWGLKWSWSMTGRSSPTESDSRKRRKSSLKNFLLSFPN